MNSIDSFKNLFELIKCFYMKLKVLTGFHNDIIF